MIFHKFPTDPLAL